MNPVNKGFGFLFEMGCGKTLTAISVMGVGWQQGRIKRVLVVAPTSVCSVWPKDMQEAAAFPFHASILLGTKEKRIKALDDLEAFPFHALKVAVINYESVWRDGLLDKLMQWDPDLIIADESQRIKSPKAEQSKAMHQLGDKARYKLILSGTPVQNNALDLYSQYRFMDKSIFGTNYYAFRGRYAIMGGFDNKQVVGYKDMEDLIRKEYSAAYRVTKAEALDLPEQTFLTRYVQLSPKDRKLYDRIKKESFAELVNGETVTATTVPTRLLRLQQFAGGFIQTDDGEKPEFAHDAKLKALEDILDDYVLDAGKKLVVFARFRPELTLIEQLRRKKKIRYGLIYGDIPLSERGGIVKDFQENPQTRVFLAQIDTAGLGITLTAADTCVYYSVNFNYAAYSQSLARIHRIGQRNTCTYIHLITEKTVDEKIMRALQKKEDLAKAVVDNWREMFE